MRTTLNYVIFRISMGDFQEWIKQGLREITQADCWLRENEERWQGEHNLSSDHELAVYVELPLKYWKKLGVRTRIYALIDDIVAVSMATPELTNEWKIRFNNLGETWLPFKFFSELDRPQNTSEPPVLAKGASTPTQTIDAPKPGSDVPLSMVDTSASDGALTTSNIAPTGATVLTPDDDLEVHVSAAGNDSEALAPAPPVNNLEAPALAAVENDAASIQNGNQIVENPPVDLLEPVASAPVEEADTSILPVDSTEPVTSTPVGEVDSPVLTVDSAEHVAPAPVINPPDAVPTPPDGTETDDKSPEASGDSANSDSQTSDAAEIEATLGTSDKRRSPPEFGSVRTSSKKKPLSPSGANDGPIGQTNFISDQEPNSEKPSS